MKSLLTLVLLLLAGTTFAQVKLNLDNGLALQGYDAVAYRDQQLAVKGTKQFAATHNGATYHFANEANKAKFVASPEPYVPAYGGWCAYAIGANDEMVEVNPKTFKVINGKTYLYYNAWGTNTLTKWNADESKLQQKADANWAKRSGVKK